MIAKCGVRYSRLKAEAEILAVLESALDDCLIASAPRETYCRISGPNWTLGQSVAQSDPLAVESEHNTDW